MKRFNAAYRIVSYPFVCLEQEIIAMLNNVKHLSKSGIRVNFAADRRCFIFFSFFHNKTSHGASAEKISTVV